jgi:hypothetical protein
LLSQTLTYKKKENVFYKTIITRGPVGGACVAHLSFYFEET